jgi:multidrug resistance efflux pump
VNVTVDQLLARIGAKDVEIMLLAAEVAAAKADADRLFREGEKAELEIKDLRAQIDELKRGKAEAVRMSGYEGSD